MLSQYVDVLGVRAFSHGEGLASDEADRIIGAFRAHAKVPVISLESAREHPCQGLADMMCAQEEFGDLIFALINYARFKNINPEEALERTNKKFIKRFQYLEKSVKEKGLQLSEMTLAEMDVYWNEAKKLS